MFRNSFFAALMLYHTKRVSPAKNEFLNTRPLAGRFNTVAAAALLFCTFSACHRQQQATNSDILDESRQVLILSTNASKGHPPHSASFTARLKSDTQADVGEIDELQWVIRGSGGFFQVIAQDFTGGRDASGSEPGVFSLDFKFKHAGKYNVRLVLNNGAYRSNPVQILVVEDSEKH